MPLPIYFCIGGAFMLCYQTVLGGAYCGDSLTLIDELEDNSVDLVMTSPPFALLKPMEYGNVPQNEYVEWFKRFAEKLLPKLKDTGSFVIDIGNTYNKGEPTYSLYAFRTLIMLVDDLGYKLAQPFCWYNQSKLPVPIEYVNKKKIRCKNAIDMVWWMSKTSNPKSDVTKVLNPYSKSMKKLFKNPEKFYRLDLPKEKRLTTHTNSWTNNNGGSIPSNCLIISNSESNCKYLRTCKKAEIRPHPARFPSQLAEFFIKLLTDEGDLVIDIFAGSNTTGAASEQLNRQWRSFELRREYVAASAFRFLGDDDDPKAVYNRIMKVKEGGTDIPRF